MTFTLSPNDWAERDVEGRVLLLHHPASPYTLQQASLTGPTATATDLADAYVEAVAPLYGLDAGGLDSDDPNLRRETPKSVLNSTVVAYQQTVRGYPIWRAALEVRLVEDPPRVVDSSSTLHLDVELDPPYDEAATFPDDEATVATVLGIDPATDPEFRVNSARTLVYRYDPGQRLDPEARETGGLRPGGPPVLPLAATPDDIAPGRHYVVREVLFDHAVEDWGLLHWRAFIEPRTRAVLYLRAFVASQHACVFPTDPVSMSGKPMDGGSPAADLDALRVHVPLPGLAAPDGGRQALRGEFVRLAETDDPVVAAPTTTAPFDFCYSAVTDDFAAASAYYNYDRLYRLVQGMGIPVADYFQDTTFPVPVDHQGWGDDVQASAEGNSTGTGMGRYRTGRARSDFPMGIAADWRIALHEFCHALLWDHVNSPNFGFCHSAGDSLAVILNDPDSTAPDRYTTFPFIPQARRRHDRDVSDGWAWGGTQDDTGYHSEQILSTLLFRVYRATGGDDPDVTVRRFAARYLAFLIVRAIGTLSTTTDRPEVLAAALMTADHATVDFEGHVGRAWHKVIRWSFEQQGLFQPPGTPTPYKQPGAPPPVDVYIDDGRGGGYLPYLPHFADSPGVWNRWAADGGTQHQQPIHGRTNHLYVQVGNRGTAEAADVRVSVYQGDPLGGLVWPTGWHVAAAPQTVAPIPSKGSAVAGPFAWDPGVYPGEAVLASVSALGDQSNAEIVRSIPYRRLVPFDNNLAQRTMTGPPSGAIWLSAAG